jgi:hypothetical protein
MNKNFKKIRTLIFGGIITPNILLAQAALRNPIKVDSIQKLITVAIDALLKLGTAVVVFMVIYSGFLFVKAQGNDSELEKAKKTFMWTVIGGVILLSARALSAVVQNTATQLGV